jgi:hypothetical protein
MAEWRMAMQSLAPGRAPAKSDQLRGDGRLIDKDEAIWFEPHPGLAAIDPEAAFNPYVGACGFRRHQCFFYM